MIIPKGTTLKLQQFISTKHKSSPNDWQTCQVYTLPGGEPLLVGNDSAYYGNYFEEKMSETVTTAKDLEIEQDPYYKGKWTIKSVL